MVLADRIGIVLPCKAEYVSVARLTVSGIASRIGFDIEIVEDIKVAVSEVCSRIINAAARLEEKYEILFDIFEDKLTITFVSDMEIMRCIFGDEDDELGLSIINSFMDKVEFSSENNNHIVIMTKKLG